VNQSAKIEILLYVFLQIYHKLSKLLFVLYYVKLNHLAFNHNERVNIIGLLKKYFTMFLVNRVINKCVFLNEFQEKGFKTIISLGLIF